MSDFSEDEIIISDESDSDTNYNEKYSKKKDAINKNSISISKNIKSVHTLKDYDDADIKQDRINEMKNKIRLQSRPIILNNNLETKSKSNINTEIVHSSSTTWNSKNQRYLVWNHIGSISLTKIYDIVSANIRFADQLGGNLNEQFVCHDEFIFGSLSKSGASFASTTKLYHHAFDKVKHLQGCNKSFRKEFSQEIILTIAMGDGWIGVATSSFLIRMFTSTGLEFRIICLIGNIVSMSGMHSRMAVIYKSNHSGETKCDVYKLSFPMNYSIQLIVKDQTLPIPNSASMLWFGFEVEYLWPVLMTTVGMVLQLHKLGSGLSGWSWAPVMDWTKTRKTFEDNCYPIMFKADTMSYVNLRVVTRPEVYPTPVQSAMKFQYPLTNETSSTLDVTQRELLQSIMRCSMIMQHNCIELDELEQQGNSLASAHDTTNIFIEKIENQYDKSVLSIFQIACSRYDEARSINCLFMMLSEKAFRVAITIANNFGRVHVAQFAENLLNQKFNIEADVNNEDLNLLITSDNNDFSVSKSEDIESTVHTGYNILTNKLLVNEKSDNVEHKLNGKIRNPFASIPPIKRTESVFDAVRDINKPSKAF